MEQHNEKGKVIRHLVYLVAVLLFMILLIYLQITMIMSLSGDMDDLIMRKGIAICILQAVLLFITVKVRKKM